MAKFFQKVSMASETVKSYMKTGLYQVGGTDTLVASGSFVILGALADHNVYNDFLSATYDMKDWNTFKCTYAGAVTDKGLYVVDAVKVNEATDGTNTYRVGAKTLVQTAAAGEKVALRRLELHDQFILGADNFTTAVASNGFAELTSTDVRLLPAATQIASGFCVRIEQKVYPSEGLDSTTGYLCTVIQL